MVERPEDLVELHHAVEEVPADVPLDRPQELPDRHVVLAARIVDDREVRVPLERVASESEAPVAQFVRLQRFDEVLRLRDHAHASVRQMSSHAYVSHSLCFVCSSASDFFGARIRYATPAGSDASLFNHTTTAEIYALSPPVCVLV